MAALKTRFAHSVGNVLTERFSLATCLGPCMQTQMQRMGLAALCVALPCGPLPGSGPSPHRLIQGASGGQHTPGQQLGGPVGQQWLAQLQVTQGVRMGQPMEVPAWVQHGLGEFGTPVLSQRSPRCQVQFPTAAHQAFPMGAHHASMTPLCDPMPSSASPVLSWTGPPPNGWTIPYHRHPPYRSLTGSPHPVIAAAAACLAHCPPPSSPCPTSFARGFAAEAAGTVAPETGADRAVLSSPSLIRDVAIIAHVDHGKTTLLDQLLRQCGTSVAGGQRVMDNMSLEKERGITIAAKYTSLLYRGYTLNVVDTPGHADFGGEVERVLDMVDGAVLLVDATEGPLAQTKFVLAKALRRGLRPIVLLNKADRPTVTPERCCAIESDVFDLFALLGASEDQLDFSVLYASARDGWAADSLPALSDGVVPEPTMAPLLDKIIEHVPPPDGDPDKPFQMLVTMTERDPFMGRLLTGRIAQGSIAVNDRIVALPPDGGPPLEEGRVTRIMKREGGLGQVVLQVAIAGDIVSLAGLEKPSVTDTVVAAAAAAEGRVGALTSTPIDVPTISMIIGVNDSPLAGRDGSQLTGSKIGARLALEAENNVSISVKPAPGRSGDAFEVQGRGELQLGVLIETMRREGFELSVSPPTVLFRTSPDGRRLEPIEDVVVEVEEQYAGNVIENLSLRKGELVEMVPNGAGPGVTRLVFTCPSRGLLGYRMGFNTDTHGTGILHRSFHEYARWRGPLDRGVRKGVILSMCGGTTSAYALTGLEPRGTLFVSPQTEVYDGMIVGEHSKEDDLEVNPAKGKHLSNVRSARGEETIRLAPPRQISLEAAIGYVAADELIEVTPKVIRLRKKLLTATLRRAATKKKGT